MRVKLYDQGVQFRFLGAMVTLHWYRYRETTWVELKAGVDAGQACLSLSWQKRRDR